MFERCDARWCPCFLEPNGVKDITDELGEWLKEPSRDEMSDVLWGIARMLGQWMGCAYLRIPGIGRTEKKFDERYAAKGCARSIRNHVQH